MNIKWIWWIILFPFFIAINILARLLAPVAVVFFSTPDRRYLRSPFKWIMTDDNDLGGDMGWKLEHMPIKGYPYNTINRICWLLRNGGHHACYYWFGCNINKGDYPLFHKYYPIGSKFLELFIGWAIKGPNPDGQCKYVFSIRYVSSTD